MSHQKDFQITTLKPGSTEDVFVTHITNPDNFYVQLQQSSDDLQEIMSVLMVRYQNSAVVEYAWQLGDVCAALYSDDEWYRGKITGIPHNKDRVEVTFVDYGNKDYIEKENIRPLHPSLLSTPVLSFHCCLQNVSCSDSFWSPEHVAQFEDLALEKEFTAHITSFDASEDVYSVELLSETGENINHLFGQMTQSQVIQANPSPTKRSVQSLDNSDLKVTFPSRAQAKPARGIACALGVDINGDNSPQLTIPHVTLNVGDVINVSVVFVLNPSEFWCHVSKFAEATKSLVEHMAVLYSSMGPGEAILHNLRPGSVCAALCEADGTWYRATIEKVTGPEASVFFLDFGNTDTVTVSNVKVLNDEFRSLPAQTVRCALSGIVPCSGVWTESASATFEDMVMENQYTATVEEKSSCGRYYISLKDFDNCSVASTFLKTCPETACVSIPAVLPKFPALSIRTTTKAEVYISWIETPGQFYVQLAENLSVLNSLTDSLQEFYSGPKATLASNIQPGSIVVAKFSEDGAWYRGVVMSISGPTSQVMFVDFGNSDKVFTSTLKQVEKQFAKIPAQAVCCCLSGVRPLSQENTWSVDAKDFLERLTEDGAICKFLSSSDGVFVVDLEVSGKNIAKEMIAYAVIRELSPDNAKDAPKFEQYQFVETLTDRHHSVYVAFVESVEKFYVQLSENMSALDDLMEELQEYYDGGKGRPLSNPRVGMPCAAKYEEDGQWYRAQIRSFTARDIDIFFVDYGNTQSAPRNVIFYLESKFITRLQAQAVQCRLSINEARSAEAQLEKFSAFTGDEVLELIVKAKEGSELLVDLVKAGVSVTNELKGVHSTARGSVENPRSGYTLGRVRPGQTVSAFASYIESPAQFWVQLAGCDDELTNVMEALSEHYKSSTESVLASPQPGQPCVALYDVDKQWYRASVISVHGTEVKVQFVDYGNSELVDRNNIKIISPVFMTSPLLAIECCLDGFNSCPVSDEAIVLLESLVTEQELSVSFKDSKNVVVKVEDKNVAQILQEKGFGPKQQKSSPQPKSFPSEPVFGSSSRSPQSLSPKGQSGLKAISPSIKFKEATPPSGSAEAIITHVDNGVGMFWVQLLSSESQLEQLSLQLQRIYGSDGPALQRSPEKGMICCAKFSVDGCWYRSLVENVTGGKVQVHFVDYGNSDNVQSSNLKSVTPDLLNVPKQAFPCKLKGLHSWNAQVTKDFERLALDQELNVRFVTSSSPFDIQVSVHGQDLLQLLLKSPGSSPQKGFGTGSSTPVESLQQSSLATDKRFGSSPKPLKERPNPKSSSALDDEPKNNTLFSSSKTDSNSSPVKLPEQVFQSQKTPTDEEVAYVSHVADDGTFFVQLIKDIDAIDELSTKLENINLGHHPCPKTGAACGVKFSEDGAWYRGIIKSVSGSWADVTFVDFGNGEKCEVNSLKPLPAHLLGPALAYQCQVDETGLLTPEQQAAFLSASEDKEYRITFKAGNPFIVIIKDENGVSLAESIFRPNTIRPACVPKEPVSASVSHVGEDGHFFLQLISTEDALETFSDELQTACEDAERLNSFDVGQVCCAKFSEDDAWYRAKIIGTSEDSVTVLFVDFGNTGTVSKNDLRELPPSIMAKPAFAFECKFQGLAQWKKGQKEKFLTMTEGKTFKARFLSSKPPYEVELTRDIGLDILEVETAVDISETDGVNEEFRDAQETVEEAVASETKDFQETEGAVASETKDDQETVEEAVASETKDVQETEEAVASETKDVQETVEEAVASETKDDQETVEEAVASETKDDQETVEEAVASETKNDQETVEEAVASETKDDQETVEEAVASETMDDQETVEEAVASEIKIEFKAAEPRYLAQTPPALDACIISYVDSDGTFYVQLVSEDENRESLTSQLQEECESPNCQNLLPSVNLACSAKFSEDEAWYRAVVEKVEEEKVEVCFVDFGNTDSVEASTLKELSAQSLSVPPLAYKCVLEDCDADLVSSKLEELTLDKTVTVIFRTTEKSPYSVNLQLENGTNVSTLLVSASVDNTTLAVTEDHTDYFDSLTTEDTAASRKCISLMKGKRMKVTVSHVISPSLFYVQCDETLTQVENLSENLFQHYLALEEGDGLIENLIPGLPCASLFGEDEAKSWYRAVVQSVSADADSCDLFFVDYGNSDTVPKMSVRKLPAEFHKLPWQCVSCSLAGVRCQENEWSEEINAAFEDLAVGKSVLADILSGDGIDNPYVVHILDLGISLANSLLALNLQGIEAAEVQKLDHVQRIFSDTKTEDSLVSELDELEMNDVTETVDDGLGEKEVTERTEKETVDDVGENEQEFSQQLKACAAQMESTMMEEVLLGQQQHESSTKTAEPSFFEKEEEDDFVDAVETVEECQEDENITEASNNYQQVYSCVSDNIAELEWTDVHICVAVSASKFWCQLPSACTVLTGSTFATEKMHDLEVVRDVKVGQLYLVSDPPCTSYRAKVLMTSFEDSEVTILKLDYGTEEKVSTRCLYPLSKQQLELPVQAFCCRLDDNCSQDWLNDLICRGEAVDKELELKVVGRKPNGTLLVDLREKASSQTSEHAADICSSSAEADTDISKRDEMLEMSLETLELSQPVLQSTILGENLTQSRMERSAGDKDYSIQYLEQGREYAVAVVAGGTPDSFYVTLVSAKGLLAALADDIEAEMTERAEGTTACESYAVNSPCLVLDNTFRWVRGQVKSCTNEGYRVACVDSGSVLEVGKEFVCDLSPGFLDTPMQAVHCCLADVVPVEGQWCDDALIFFTEFISHSPLKLFVSGLSSELNTYYGVLSDEQTQNVGNATADEIGSDLSVNRILVELGYAEALPGSALDVELQVERTINDPEQLKQLETSFSEISCLRENSLGDSSGIEDGDTELERVNMNASGDASLVFDNEGKNATSFSEIVCQQENSAEDALAEIAYQQENLAEDTVAEIAYQQENLAEDALAEIAYQQENLAEDALAEIAYQQENLAEDALAEIAYQQENLAEDAVAEPACQQEKLVEDVLAEIAYQQENLAEDTVAETACLQENLAKDTVAEPTCQQENLAEDALAEIAYQQENLAEDAVAETACLQENLAKDTVTETAYLQENLAKDTVEETTCLQENLAEDAVAKIACLQENLAKDTVAETICLQENLAENALAKIACLQENLAKDTVAETICLQENLAEDAVAKIACLQENLAEDAVAETDCLQENLAEDAVAKIACLQENLAEDAVAKIACLQENLAEDAVAKIACLQENLAEDTVAEDTTTVQEKNVTDIMEDASKAVRSEIDIECASLDEVNADVFCATPMSTTDSAAVSLDCSKGTSSVIIASRQSHANDCASFTNTNLSSSDDARSEQRDFGGKVIGDFIQIAVRCENGVERCAYGMGDDANSTADGAVMGKKDSELIPVSTSDALSVNKSGSVCHGASVESDNLKPCLEVICSSREQLTNDAEIAGEYLVEETFKGEHLVKKIRETDKVMSVGERFTAEADEDKSLVKWVTEQDTIFQEHLAETASEVKSLAKLIMERAGDAKNLEEPDEVDGFQTRSLIKQLKDESERLAEKVVKVMDEVRCFDIGLMEGSDEISNLQTRLTEVRSEAKCFLEQVMEVPSSETAVVETCETDSFGKQEVKEKGTAIGLSEQIMREISEAKRPEEQVTEEKDDFMSLDEQLVEEADKDRCQVKHFLEETNESTGSERHDMTLRAHKTSFAEQLVEESDEATCLREQSKEKMGRDKSVTRQLLEETDEAANAREQAMAEKDDINDLRKWLKEETDEAANIMEWAIATMDEMKDLRKQLTEVMDEGKDLRAKAVEVGDKNTSSEELEVNEINVAKNFEQQLGERKYENLGEHAVEATEETKLLEEQTMENNDELKQQTLKGIIEGECFDNVYLETKVAKDLKSMLGEKEENEGEQYEARGESIQIVMLEDKTKKDRIVKVMENTKEIADTESEKVKICGAVDDLHHVCEFSETDPFGHEVISSSVIDHPDLKYYKAGNSENKCEEEIVEGEVYSISEFHQTPKLPLEAVQTTDKCSALFTATEIVGLPAEVTVDPEQILMEGISCQDQNFEITKYGWGCLKEEFNVQNETCENGNSVVPLLPSKLAESLLIPEASDDLSSGTRSSTVQDSDNENIPTGLIFTEATEDCLSPVKENAMAVISGASVVGKDTDQQALTMETLPACASDFLDIQLTADDMEKVAAQLEDMAMLEMQKYEDEEAKEHKEKLAQILDDCGDIE